LLGIALFEATAFIIMLVLFCFSAGSAWPFPVLAAGGAASPFHRLCEVAFLIRQIPALNLTLLAAQAAGAALVSGLGRAVCYGSDRRISSLLPLIGLILAGIYYWSAAAPGILLRRIGRRPF